MRPSRRSTAVRRYSYSSVLLSISGKRLLRSTPATHRTCSTHGRDSRSSRPYALQGKQFGIELAATSMDASAIPADPDPTSPPPTAPAAPSPHRADAAQPAPARSKHGSSEPSVRPRIEPSERRGTTPRAPDRHTRPLEPPTIHRNQRSPPARQDGRPRTSPPETPGRRRSRPGTPSTPTTCRRTTACNEATTSDPQTLAPTPAGTRPQPPQAGARSTAPPNADTNARSAEARPPQPHQTPARSAIGAQQTPPARTQRPDRAIRAGPPVSSASEYPRAISHRTIAPDEDEHDAQ